jgi:flagellar biosynthesis protein FlhG
MGPGKPSAKPQADASRALVVSGSKGGVGASMIATNLGIFLAQIGKRVLLVDLSFADSCLYAWLGMPRPRYGIADYAAGCITDLRDAVVETPITGLSLLGGASGVGVGGPSPLSTVGVEDLLRRVRMLGADYALLDVPAGLDAAAIELFGLADASIAVTVATPDAVEATYRFFAAVYLVRARRAAAEEGAAAIVDELALRPGRPPAPREVIGAVAAAAPVLGEEVRRLAAVFHPQIIVNQTRIKADEELGEAMVSAAIRWLGVAPRLLGEIGWDDNVWLSLRRGLPLLVEFPRSRACRDLELIVRRLLSQDGRDLFAPASIPPATADQNLYELLEIYPGASEEEVRRARKQIREWYGTDGLAGRGACSEAERADYVQKTEEAHATLLDRSKRREYDRRVFPDGFPSAHERPANLRDSIAGQVTATRDSLPDVEIGDGQLVDGAFLGRVRRELGVELVDICNRAKISVAYLRAIEEERFADLPEAVFTRGFVAEFARFLKVDAQRAARDFMAKYDAARPVVEK